MLYCHLSKCFNSFTKRFLFCSALLILTIKASPSPPITMIREMRQKMKIIWSTDTGHAAILVTLTFLTHIHLQCQTRSAYKQME